MGVGHKTGVSLSKEHREAISRARRGWTPTAETRRRMSESKRGELNPMWGSHHSEHTKGLLRAKNKGRKRTPEERAQMAESQRRRRARERAEDEGRR